MYTCVGDVAAAQGALEHDSSGERVGYEEEEAGEEEVDDDMRWRRMKRRRMRNGNNA